MMPNRQFFLVLLTVSFVFCGDVRANQQRKPNRGPPQSSTIMPGAQNQPMDVFGKIHNARVKRQQRTSEASVYDEGSTSHPDQEAGRQQTGHSEGQGWQYSQITSTLGYWDQRLGSQQAPSAWQSGLRGDERSRSPSHVAEGEQYPQPQEDRSRQSFGNINLDLELLRLTDDDQRICSAYGSTDRCGFELRSVMNIDGQPQEPASMSVISRSMVRMNPGSTTTADINLRMQSVLCDYRGGRQMSTLRVEVIPLQAGLSEGSRMDQLSSQQGVRDQYERDRYEGRQDASQMSMDSQRDLRPRENDALAVFECDIILYQADQQESFNAPWQTVPCRPLDPSNRMELMFRYLVYRTDSTNCYQPSVPISWTSLPAPGAL